MLSSRPGLSGSHPVWPEPTGLWVEPLSVWRPAGVQADDPLRAVQARLWHYHEKTRPVLGRAYCSRPRVGGPKPTQWQ